MSDYCSDCGDYFYDENELRMLAQTSPSPSLNHYRKYSDMLGHLEYGCGNINAEDPNKSAAVVYQWRHIMDPDYRDDMLDMSARYGRNWNHDGQPWKCPNCGKWFKKLSALFQHIWSVYGQEEENRVVMGKLKKWLWNRHA